MRSEEVAANDVFPTLRRCAGCGALRLYPKPVCPACRDPRTEGASLSGLGRVYSFTIVHRAPTPDLKAETPYVIALIDLDEGLRAPARLSASDGHVWRCGDRVRLAASDKAYPVFNAATEGASG